MGNRLPLYSPILFLRALRSTMDLIILPPLRQLGLHRHLHQVFYEGPFHSSR